MPTPTFASALPRPTPPPAAVGVVRLLFGHRHRRLVARFGPAPR